MKKSILVCGVLIAAASVAAPAAAAPLVTETFDTYAPQIGWTGSGVWTTGGSVDLVSSGAYGLTCAGGTGNCVDLTGDRPGTISRTVTLVAGRQYALGFAYTGNQLPGFTQASFDYSIGSLAGTIAAPTGYSSTFTAFSGLFTATAANSVLTFSQNAGGDQYRGSILDSITITAVPELSVWGMMIAGFGGVGVALRRRRAAKAVFA